MSCDNLYYHSMGKQIKISRIFSDVGSANAYMELNPDFGVISEMCGYILLARMDDK